MRSYVSRVRRLLPEGTIITAHGGYALMLDPADVDSVRFTDLIKRAGSLGHEDRISTLEEALLLWRGIPFADLPESERAQAEARRLVELRLAAIEGLCASRLQAESPQPVVAEIEVLVVEHPYREGLWAQLMLGLYLSGRQVDALAAFQRARDRLAKAGVQPGSDLRELEARILRQDPALMTTQGGTVGT